MLTLAQRVDDALKAGYKKAALARAAGVSTAAVSHWAQGRTHQVSGKSASGLAKLTGWSADWWLGQTTVKTPSFRQDRSLVISLERAAERVKRAYEAAGPETRLAFDALADAVLGDRGNRTGTDG